MTWTLGYSDTAKKQLKKLDPAVAREVKKYLADVCALEDPAERGHPLRHDLAGQHTYRIGQLRVLVRIQRQIVTVTVIKMERRDSAY